MLVDGSKDALLKNQLAGIKRQWLVGNKQTAVNECQGLLRQNPQYAPAHLVYAGFLDETGNAQEASKHFQAACSLPDTDVDCFLQFAAFLKKHGQLQNALEVLKVGHNKWPNVPLMAREFGVMLAENDHHHEAAQAFEHCLELNPDDWICWNHLGCARALNNHAEEAIACFEKSLALGTKALSSPANKQDIESIRLNQAGAFTHAGKTDAAREIFEAILRDNPANHRAWFDLANLIKCDEQQVEEMERQLQSAIARGDLHAARDLHFALGRSWDNMKNPRKAMEHLDAGNKIVRAELNYNSAEVCERLRRTPDFFPPEVFADLETRSKQSTLRYRPVFIVGMPRCGSTLTEQILASHPQVIGAGELTTLPTIKHKLLGADFGQREGDRDLARAPRIANELREAYLTEIERIAKDLRPDLDPQNGEILIVDKMLGNFDMIGMILQAIPEARIIHCRRNPVDTCLSCYSKLFRSPVSYSYDQKELAEFYLAYEEQMTYWHRHIPASFLMESRYEDMIADTEQQSRKLLEFVGLPWNPEVLEFHKKKRTVSTASMAQVRKPIYKSSVERWRPYAPYIQPMLSILGQD
jgi:tetratricopeptide (TPR) repeat protein